MHIITEVRNTKFNLIKSTHTLMDEFTRLPKEHECFKFLSFGDFSSACFISAVGALTHIRKLYVSTFRVGKNEMKLMKKLHRENKLDDVTIVMLSQMLDGEDDKTSRLIRNIANENKWKVIVKKNHSKIFLFDTDKGKYVMETSSNLNENPKLEQYSFYCCEKSYNFFQKYLFGDEEEKIRVTE